MADQRARVLTIFDDVACRVVPPGVGQSGPADSNDESAVGIAHYRSAGAARSNTKAG